MRGAEILRAHLELGDCQKILIVSHDRGGAEVVADIATYLDHEVHYVSAGPARQVFQGRFPSRREVTLVEGLTWADAVIVTTGWQTDWEISAKSAAQDLGLRTAVVLDNWVNFAGRFRHHGYEITPRELWVVDELAARTASETFPKALVRQLPWSHYDSVVESIVAAREHRTPSRDAGLRVLFVGENVGEFEESSGEDADFGFDQFDALSHLGTVLDKSLGKGYALRVRPHPSEDLLSYVPTMTGLGDSVELSTRDLMEDLAWCDIAVGLSSIALYYASRAGIPTYTCFPVPESAYHTSPWAFPGVEELPF